MVTISKMYVLLAVIIFVAGSANSLYYTGNMSFYNNDQWFKTLKEKTPTPESLGQVEINQNISKAKHIFGCRNVAKQVGLPTKQRRIRRAALWDLLDFASKTVHKGPIYVPSVLLPKKEERKTKRTCGKRNK